MKKLLTVLLLAALLFLLSSCYSSSYVNQLLDEQESRMLEEYADLDEKYYDASARVEELEIALGDIFDHVLTLKVYFEDDDPDYTEDDAYSAAENIYDILTDLGY